MKKMKQIKTKLVAIISLLLLIMFASCKTTPPPRPQDEGLSENLAKDAEKARALAIEKGADKTHAELFSVADKKLKVAKNMVGSKREGAIKEFAELALTYKALANLAEAYQLKEEIAELGFANLDPDMYKKAEDLYKDALSRCTKDGEGALKTSNEALSLYDKLCEKGYAKLIDQARNEAKAAKNNCDSINASRSMTKEYNEAVKVYNEGASALREKHYRKAYKSYILARDLFNKTFKAAEEKKKEAEAALARAKAKIRESSALAKEADKASPLKIGAEGFGEVDSSSLENKDSDKQEVDEIAD